MRRIVVGPSGVWVTVMRFLVLPILAVGAVYAAAPSQAQTYDPNYPICLQIYDDMVHYYFECRLYIDGSISGVGVGPRGAVRGQSVSRQGVYQTRSSP